MLWAIHVVVVVDRVGSDVIVVLFYYNYNCIDINMDIEREMDIEI